jgi:polysaccharide export outer membrane protein
MNLFAQLLRRCFCIYRFGPLGVAVLALSGCATPVAPPPSALTDIPTLTLRAGDSIKVSFPGTPNLDNSQTIRRDGKINLSLIGEIQASGKTPADLEKELAQLYSTQIVSKEVKVTILSSNFEVYVIGAVMKPGKISLDRAITVFEAIVEAGGFDREKANTKEVRIIRNKGGAETENFTVNLQKALDGQPISPVPLRNYDIVYVPEKFQWF